MLTIHTTLNSKLLYPIEAPFEMEDILFFDIETTGLSARTSFLYLIGCMYFVNDTWQITQWFADEVTNEAEILGSFFQKVTNYKRIVHYNGSGFDIPFIQNKCKQHNIDASFDLIESFDIYKKLLPYKRLLPMDNLKLKTIEAFLGVEREDTYSGADLIQIYANYLGSNRYEKLHLSNPQKEKDNSSSNKIPSSKELLEKLLLHNKEDVEGLLTISNILCYIDIFDCDVYRHIFLNKDENLIYSKKIWNVDITSDIESQTNYLVINVIIPYEIPKLVHLENKLSAFTDETYHNKSIQLIASSTKITLKIPIYKGELKYYFENYKEYYYLPKEDMAIHKSVAQFVDKDYRVQAKANTCYSKKIGSFIPLFGDNAKNGFKADYQNHIKFIELDLAKLQEPTQLYEYFTNCIIYVRQSKETEIKFDK